MSTKHEVELLRELVTEQDILIAAYKESNVRKMQAIKAMLKIAKLKEALKIKSPRKK